MKQKKLFLEIWEERKHKCDLCEKHLGHEPLAFFFSHILSKGAYPAFKLNKENIMLNCWDCHQSWDFGDPKKLKNYNNIVKLKNELKYEYNTK